MSDPIDPAPNAPEGREEVAADHVAPGGDAGPQAKQEEQVGPGGQNAQRGPSGNDRLKELGKLGFEVFVLALVIYVFIFQISIVKGQSMMPSFAEGDRLVIDKLTYRFSDVKRFDVVVFSVPKAQHKDYIKRVVGLPGERIELRDGGLYIGGKFVLQDFSFRNQVQARFGEEVVEEGHFFVLGDNRSASTDSRKSALVGQVPIENIRGRVRLRVWPLSKFKLF